MNTSATRAWPDQWRSELLARGAGRVSVELRDARDRIIASDPGLARLRQATRATVAVSSTLLVELGLATRLGAPSLLPMMLGAVVAMLMSTGIRENRRTAVLRTAAGAPVAAALGAGLGTAAGQRHTVGLAVFVAVSFFAVWVRRFGRAWFTYGFLAWQAYFFILFLHPPLKALPLLLVAVVVATAWVTLLLVTVFYDDPQAQLRRTVTALRARARAGVAAALEVLDQPDDVRAVRQLRGQLVRLSEVALLFDGQLADARSLPAGVTATTLRRWVVEIEIGMDEVVGAVVELAASREQLSPQVLQDALWTLRGLGWGDLTDAREAAAALRQPDRSVVPAARRLGAAAAFLLTTVERWTSGRLVTAPERLERDGGDEEEQELETFRDDGFEPVVTLLGGNLPGSAALTAEAVSREDAPWWSPSRMSLTTRQAVQATVAAALAIVAGEVISERRFYWAVIAAFIGFTGTSTSAETLRKSVSRVAGTFGGLVVAVVLANLTAGHSRSALVLILGCIFLAFYLQAVSYGAMILFITVMLGQLYTVLHTFTDQVLVLRLEETTAGALIGVLVSLVVLPASSRSTLKVARKALLDDLGELLEECGRQLGEGDPVKDLMTTVVTLDSSSRQVVRGAQAMVHGRLFGADRDGLRHRVAVLGACASTGRAVATAVAGMPGGRHPGLGQACEELAREARRLAGVPSLATPPAMPEGESDVVTRIAPLLGEVEDDADLAPLRRGLRRLADALALLTPRGRVNA